MYELLPYSEAQRAILSIIINSGNEAFQIVAKHIEERHFTELRYKLMWRCIEYLYTNEHEITDITVKHSMSVTRDNNGQVVFDMLDVHEGNHDYEFKSIIAYKAGEGVMHLNSYIDIILDKFGVEKVSDMVGELNILVKNGSSTLGQLLSVIHGYADFFSEKDRKQPMTLVEVGETLIEKITNSPDGDESIMFTNIDVLDDYVWLTEGNQTVIAGDTGHGKTSLGLQILWNLAKQKKKVINKNTGSPLLDENGEIMLEHRRVLFFSLEMTSDELLKKLCCVENNISMQDFTTLLTSIEQAGMLRDMVEKTRVIAPNFMVDYSSSTLRDIEAKCNMVHATYGDIDAVLVDYLQLVEEAKDKFQREDVIYRHISRTTKKMAMRLECHVILLSQLNKAMTNRTGTTNHYPTLDRLFGSSAIKQDATHVIFVYREWSVGIKQTRDDDGNYSAYYLSRIIIAKHRFGENQIDLLSGFIPYIAYFVNFSEIQKAGLLQSYGYDNEKLPHVKEFMQTKEERNV